MAVSDEFVDLGEVGLHHELQVLDNPSVHDHQRVALRVVLQVGLKRLVFSLFLVKRVVVLEALDLVVLKILRYLLELLAAHRSVQTLFGFVVLKHLFFALAQLRLLLLGVRLSDRVLLNHRDGSEIGICLHGSARSALVGHGARLISHLQLGKGFLGFVDVQPQKRGRGMLLW